MNMKQLPKDVEFTCTGEIGIAILRHSFMHRCLGVNINCDLWKSLEQRNPLLTLISGLQILSHFSRRFGSFSGNLQRYMSPKLMQCEYNTLNVAHLYIVNPLTTQFVLVVSHSTAEQAILH